MYVVRDGARHLKFDGTKLAESTSRSRGRTRWVEFQLYITAGGQYVLARTGVSLYYHRAECAVVARNKISGVELEDLPAGLVQCETCQPVLKPGDLFYPETPRYWAQVSDSPNSVVDSLHKYDDQGSRYLTNVARTLLTTAANIDDGIADAFYNEIID